VTRIFGLPEKDAGLLVELTAAIAWENHWARFNHALCMG
jgi:alkylhydroperoxidase family enzyme